MTFRLQPLEFPLEAAGDWIERELTNLPDGVRGGESLLLGHIVRARRSYCICGVRGVGKTSLLNEIAFTVNAQAVRVIAIGPLSMPRLTRGRGSYGLEAELQRSLRELADQFPNRIKLPDFSSLPRTFKQFPALLEKLSSDTIPNARFLILLDDLDGVSVKDRKLILGDLKKLMALSRNVRALCAGNFLDDEYPSAVAPLKEDLMGFSLGAFGRTELEAFFIKIERHFGITFDQMTSAGRAKREVFKAWSQSVPYFLQAMTLNIFEQGYPSGMNIGARTLEDMTIKMFPALLSPILEPLSELKGKARGKAQEIFNRLLSSEGMIAAADVDWADPVVRNLWRWGIIWRNQTNHNMVWGTPLLASWFKKAGPLIDAEAPGIERKQTEKKSKKERGTNGSPRTKTSKSEEKYERFQLEEGAAQISPHAGTSPAAPPFPESPSGTADDRSLPGSPSSPLGRRLLKKGPPSGGRTKKGPPPRGPKAIERYVNLWFTRVRGADQSSIPKDWTLPFQKQVFLRVNIAPFDKASILEDAQPFVSDAEMARHFPETIGRPVPLEVVLFSRENEFFIAPEDRTQKVDLVSGQPTRTLYFPVRPLRMPSSRLRVCVFYRNHLLQSLDVTVVVRPTPMRMPKAQRACVEMTFSAGFSGVQALPPRALWLGINHATDGTHTLNLKDSENALSRNVERELEHALITARKALREVSFIEKKDDDGNPVKELRFRGDNYPDVNDEEMEERLKEDLTILAEAGMNLYQAIFGDVPVAEEKETVKPLVDAMKKTLRDEQVIQIARLKSIKDIWPWAMVYDSVMDPRNVKKVCLAFRGDDGRALPYAEGVKKCQHRDAADRRGRDKTVVCPYSFWGFKHIIEQPIEPGGKKAFSNLILEIKVGAKSVLHMPLESGLGKDEAAHIDEMQALDFTPLASLEEITRALSLEPHVLYFFCHGKYDSQDSPYLQVGTDESLLPAELNDLDFSWANSHGLVFINGCHTVEMEPKDLALIMGPFVNADASGIIGTEISVTTGLAREFAHEFFMRFLGRGFPNQKVGQIIKDLRLNLLMKYNPLGLVYTPYCSADLHVVR